jgi:Sulfotransferase family
MPDTVEICPDPVFIIGSPRSGTTILARSLGEHSELWTSEESHFLDRLVDVAADIYASGLEGHRQSWIWAQGVGRAEFVAALGTGVNALFTSRSNGRRWIEHTPYYLEIAETLAEMFPEARFIHMLRDGRRVVHSMLHLLDRPRVVVGRARSRGPRVGGWGHDFRAACQLWATSVETASAFVSEHPERARTVVHERLVDDPSAGFRELFDFLGVDWEPGPVELFRGGLVNSSFESKPDPEPWLGWSPEQRAIFHAEAGPTLVASGFARPSP